METIRTTPGGTMEARDAAGVWHPVPASAAARIEELTDALMSVRRWCDAYPERVFTPMTDEELKRAVAAANDAVPAASDRMHASWARHILSGVRAYTDVIAGG